MNDHVRARLTQVMEAEGLDALIASTPENLFYVTGFRSLVHELFRGAELYGVFTRQGTGLVVPFIDATGVAADAITCDRIACYGKFFFAYADAPGPIGARVRELTSKPAASAADALAGVLADLGVTRARVGLDEGNLFPDAWRRLAERLGGMTLIPAYQHFRTARAVKNDAEIACLKRAAQIAEEAVDAVLAVLKPGVTERDAVTVYEHEIARRGASKFFTVITIGERAALADVYPSDRAVNSGDLIRFDVGCTYRGYRSDIARTAVLGRPAPKQTNYYRAILAGEEAAIDMMKPGVTAGAIFDVAVKVTRETGIAHYQRHHVGHGIGLEGYDPPTLTPDNPTVLEPGMVYCVETPYYEHGWGGVQVEDTVAVTRNGVRLLTRGSRELRVLE